MRTRNKVILGITTVVILLTCAAILLHLPATHRIVAHLYGTAPDGASHLARLHSIQPQGPAASLVGVSEPAGQATARALEGVAAIGRRWDTDAFAETITLYTAVHNELEWPGVLAPETVQYGPDPQQTFELFRPEQGFSEPGPVFVSLHGNGLGAASPIVPGSDGLVFSHMGRLAATAGGIGVLMNYRPDGSEHGSDPLETSAEDLRLVIEWIVGKIAPFGGDPDTIVVLANSEGATRAAGYLFNESWQTASGPRVAAAILSSGLFGDSIPGLADAIDAYRGERVPLALWSGEFDTAAVTDGVTALYGQLCAKYGHCPQIERFAGHNHLSHVLSLGSPDTAAMNAFIRFYHTVR